MKKQEYVDTVANKAGITKKDILLVLDAMLETLQECLVKKDSVSFVGFGTFSTSPRAARTARVPGTDRIVDVPATTAVKFKAGKVLKEAVAKK
jgi:DNA-binding protein HU-beta